jgi:hypothetical protein
LDLVIEGLEEEDRNPLKLIADEIILILEHLKTKL